MSVVHLLDLNGLKIVLSEAGRQGARVFAPLATDVAGGPTNEAMAAFLQDHLHHRTEGAVEGFLGAVLEAMNVFNRRTNYRRLSWVTLWDSFAPFANEGPDRWLELVGISRAEFPRCIRRGQRVWRQNRRQMMQAGMNFSMLRRFEVLGGRWILEFPGLRHLP